MQLDDLSYDLPAERIAQFPLPERADSRLLVVERHSETISHDSFFRLGKYLPAHSILVINNSKVIPARLWGRRATGGRVEILLLRKRNEGEGYEALFRPLNRLQNGETIAIDESDLRAEVVDCQRRIVQFNKTDITSDLERIGHMPLPPYIKRLDEPLDRQRYQTVYAKNYGAVAAPTAGLHFTPELLSELKKSGHSLVEVTLHVNYATFAPVKEKDPTRHVMHEEEYAVSSSAQQELTKAKQSGRRIVAVGTTSCRVLETVAARGPWEGRTNLFICPGYRFLETDILLTNFHRPLSTLLMLVYAFGGIGLIRRAYEEAIKENYRFFSYGDAMLIL